MPPQKGKPRPRGSEDEFVLFLQGIPAHCRWQELKDLVRQTALHIRQAVVYDDHHGFPTGLGQIIVKNEDEAWRTYHRLSTNGWEGQSLVVTLARTSSPTRPIAGPTKSPQCVIPPNYVAGYSTPPRVPQNMAVPPSPISPEPVMAGTNPTYPPPEYGHPSMMNLPPHHFIPIFPDPLTQPMPGIPPSPALRPSFGDPLAFTVFPPYPISPVPPFQDPSLHSHGRRAPHKPATYTYTYSYTPTPMPFYPPHALHQPQRPHPRRTIFIQNLSPTTTKSELQSHLQETGTIDACEVPLDPSSSRCKGFARITFRTSEEAKRAVARFNNSVFKDAKIRVKIDRSIPLAASYALEPPGVPMAIVTAPMPPACAPQGPGPDDDTKPADRCQPLVVNGSGIKKTEVAA
ncbi:hypothetical protein BDV25DRAFT_61223 [Aspergillus avenaceus]|uniref:RRM domain-containing protein n=1 Tax=Aspergillus avenaceus TaxID=36643 RepID=A0A5N6THH7_ASPAV|nr:hypothetical protein BDV25DRAFT_61223 [Aspergillus avenaceus]